MGRHTRKVSPQTESGNKNSVPEQRTGSLPAIQQRQNNLYAMYTPDVHLSAVVAEHGCAGEYNLVKMPSDR